MFLKPTLIAASMAALAGIAMPQMASAVAPTTFSGSTGASAACKAAAGPGAQVFYFDTLGALNTSAGTQYLTCNIPDVGMGNGNITSNPISELDVTYSNPSTASVTFTCVFQVVGLGAGGANAVFSQTVAANTIGSFHVYSTSGTPALPPRADFNNYIMSCAIPAGARLDSLKAYYTVPV